jgi:alcohol dehydrogenase
MLAVHINSGRVSVEKTDIPRRPPGFVLIRMSLAGICNTDLELQRGYYNFQGIPGHEFVGIVVDADNPGLLNRRVVAEINFSCGYCSFCRAFQPRHCDNRSVLGIVRHPGAFAEYLTVPQANVHLVPDSVSDREAVFVEPIAAACEILDQVPLTPADEVAVLGDGKLGLLITQVLLASGIPVTLYGRHEAKLTIARAAGANTLRADDLSKTRYRFVVECTGSAAGLASAISMTQPLGTIVMKSTIHEAVKIDTAAVIVNELKLVGSRCGRFEPAIQLLRDQKIAAEPMIAAEFELAQAPEAFAKAARKGVLKVLLRTFSSPADHAAPGSPAPL